MYDTTHYESVCLRALDRMGIAVEDVTVHTYENDRDRWEAWLVESLLSGFRYVRQGDFKVALRCALQVTEYCGRIGYWPGSSISDAYLTLRNILEDKLSGEG